MTEKVKWKSKLLSSSVPLEYEVAKALVSAGFAVDSDYSYSRDDGGVTKDFSVDIHATAYLPLRSRNYSATLELLVECKHRHPGNKWLFFPDPNASDMSPFTLGRTLRAVDGFSKVFFAPNCTVPFDENACFCIKGVEVDISNGVVHDAEIRHGLSQLQYALPRLLSDSITFNLLGHEDDNSPFLFCPILLTTSEVLVAHEGISINSVERASSLEDIASAVPFVVLYLDSTPEFARHRKTACSELDEISRHRNTKEVEAYRSQMGEYAFQLPVTQCMTLANSVGAKFGDYFSQAIVCSLRHFPALIEEIKKVSVSAIKTKKKRKVRNVRRTV